MTGGLITALLVGVRIAATTSANVVQKRLLAPGPLLPVPLFAAMWGWMTLFTAPWWITSWQLRAEFWGWMFAACLLEVPGNVLLLRSLQHTELSIFGPLSSFKPVVSLLIAFLLFGEQPSWAGLIGVVVVLLGTLWLTSEPRTQAYALPRAARRAEIRAGIRDRLLAVLLTAVASVFLKQGMADVAQAQVLAVWCLVSWLLAALWMLLRALQKRTWIERASHADRQAAHPSPFLIQSVGAGRAVARRMLMRGLRRQPLRRGVVAAAVATLVMQAATISLFARMPVGYALALFQIGSLVSVLVGHRMFGETDVVRRLLAAGIMIVGAVIIIVFG